MFPLALQSRRSSAGFSGPSVRRLRRRLAEDRMLGGALASLNALAGARAPGLPAVWQPSHVPPEALSSFNRRVLSEFAVQAKAAAVLPVENDLFAEGAPANLLKCNDVYEAEVATPIMPYDAKNL